MNILHHKSWHVRNKDNIAKVRKDEAEAAEKEQAELRRAKLAEQEARLRFLRNRSKGSSNHVETVEPVLDKSENDQSSKTSVDIFTSEGNINFFKDVEAGIKVTGVNKEHEEEAKKEKEDYEKKIGLLTYLGQDTLESTGGKEWYSESSKSFTHFKDKDKSLNDEVEFKNKSRLDPLSTLVKTLLPVGPSTSSNSLDSLTPKAITKYCKKIKAKVRLLKKHKRKTKKRKKDKKSKKLKRKRRQSTDSVSSNGSRDNKLCNSYPDDDSDEEESLNVKKKQLETLREERLKREAIEKKRAERLLNGKDPDVEEVIKVPLPYTQKYSSQFNPHIARQNEWIKKPLDEMFKSGKG